MDLRPPLSPLALFPLMVTPSLSSLQLLQHWWPLLTPCQQLPGHLTGRVQEADLSSAQRTAVRALTRG